MATFAAFGVLAGGGAYAASKIDTPDISNKAITAKKLDAKAVKTSKLRPEAVTGEKLADGAVETRNLSLDAPLAMAGVVVYNGAVFGWFNRVNDQEPTVTRTEAGVYDLRIPGLDTGFSGVDLLSSVNLIGDAPLAGEVTSRWTDVSGGGGLHPIIYTFDSAGNPADRSFVYFVYRAEHSES